MKLPIGHGRMAEIVEPTRAQFSDNLGGAIEFRLAHVIYKLLEITGGGLGAFAGSFLCAFLEQVEPGMVKYTAPLIEQLLATPDLPPWARTFFHQLLEPADEAAAAMLAGVGAQAGGVIMSNVLSTLLSPITYALNRKIKPARVDLGTAAAFSWRTPSMTNEMYEELRDVGWATPIIANYHEILRPRPDIGTLMAYYGRTEGNPGPATAEMLARGYTNEDAGIMREMWHVIPGVQDLVAMAVREAWDDSTASRYGYDADMPGEFVNWTGRQGLSAEWAKRYWRAHWQLPGPTMAAEMLHRTSYSEDDYKRLLKIADYPAVYRQWMTEIAYAPYTRVDIRRMYQIGVLDEKDLIRAYKDIGYNLEKATALKDFTVLEYGEEARTATKSDVLNAYELRRFTLAAAKKMLTDLGYPAWVADMELARVDLQLSNARISEVVKQTKLLYTAGEIDRTNANGKLAALNLPALEIEAYLDDWDIVRAGKVARPTRSELRDMYEGGILSGDELRAQLRGYLLSEKYINWYILLTQQGMVKTARTAQEVAAKEQERLRVSKLASELDRQLADRDLLIATARVAIADIQLFLVSWVPPAQMEAAYEQIANLRARLFQVTEAERPAIQAQIDTLEALIERLTPDQITNEEKLIATYKLQIAGWEKVKRELRKVYLAAKGG